MKKILIILILSFFNKDLFSQKIHSQYIFKKEKTKSRLFNKINWYYLESDSLVLNNNGTFHRTYKFIFHETSNLEHRGYWSIKNEILLLEITSEKNTANWKEINKKCEYKIKKRKINPVNRFGLCSNRKLKLIKREN